MKQTLCLNMIVKDEADTIGIALASVKNLIDYWVICDTGSTDNTKEIIQEALKDIPGELVEHDWVDFGTNRTKAIKAAQGKADFILLMDADWSVQKNFDLPEITADVCMMTFEGPLDWRLPGIVRDGLPFYWYGRIHETLFCELDATREPFDALSFINRATQEDGEQSLERNLKVLLEDWNEIPSPRTAFYLANTYTEMGLDDKAVEFYTKRLSLGGSKDEIWFSQYQIGRIRDDVDELVKAWHMGPHRVEPLYYIAKHFRERQMFKAGLLFAETGIKFEYPENDTMFVDREIFVYRIMFEFALCAFYCDRKDDAKMVFEYLYTLEGLPEDIFEACENALGIKEMKV